MVERLEFEFPMPALGHNRLIVERNKVQIKRLVRKELANEPEAVRKAAGKVTDSLVFMDLRLGEPQYNASVAIKKATWLLSRAQMEGELGRVLRITKKAYDKSVDEVVRPPSPLDKLFNQNKEKPEKEIPDEMYMHIPFGIDKNELYDIARDVLLRNQVSQRQLGDEFYSKFTEAVLTLFRGETLSRSQLISQGLKPKLVYNQFKSILGTYNIARSDRRRRLRRWR